VMAAMGRQEIEVQLAVVVVEYRVETFHGPHTVLLCELPPDRDTEKLSKSNS
jgi:hypothetical protein